MNTRNQSESSTRHRPPERGGEAGRRPAPKTRNDPVTEAGKESFPASDPPAHSPAGGDEQRRKLLQEQELLDWMTERLHREPEYRKCRFTAVQLVDVDRDHENNWLSADLHCDAAPSMECMDAADAVIEEAKAYFNVADSHS